jgi:hypothetical protein
MHSTRYSCQTLDKLEFSLQIFEKSVQREPRRTGGQTHTTKPMIIFRNSANASENITTFRCAADMQHSYRVS